MIKYDYKLRVPYVDVDRMAFVYHAHYIEYFDMARTELIRSLGISNLEMEEEGVALPVVEINIKYAKPARYDDVLTIRTYLREMPSATITFHYEVLRDEVLLCRASVKLAFMNSATSKACRPPQKLIDVLKKCGDF